MNYEQKMREQVKNNIKTVLENIDNACYKVQKKITDIKLVAVTKTVHCDIVNFALQNGIDTIGENRVQEFLNKYSYYNLKNKQIHFIGHLQTNKVKYIIDKVDVIESVDSLPLLKEIDKQAKKHSKIMDIFIQVNISDDINKYGLKLENIDFFLNESRKYNNIEVKGFMCIPKKYKNYNKTKIDFEKMNKLYIDKIGKKVDNINIMFLSMGMSSDYIDAILLGANVVRIGSGLFDINIVED